jgi:drug/metabolite transporter (DMT)-like permease
VVAVIAGSLILAEPISPQIVLGGGIVVAGVAMMVTARSRTIKAGGTAH